MYAGQRESTGMTLTEYQEVTAADTDNPSQKDLHLRPFTYQKVPLSLHKQSAF